MSAAANLWRTDRSHLIAMAGAIIALGAILLKLDYFFGPGFGDVLGGLAHHAFVLALLLVLTSGSRTVSLGTLGIFWLVGVWAVYAVAYLLESRLASVFDLDVQGDFVPIWLAPSVEELAKLAPVAAFLVLAASRGRHPSMSDGLLLGFMVGAGVSFQEDAQVGEILVSGDGWAAAKPWTMVFPTVSPLDTYFALNHALWAALSGLFIGAAVLLRHWRWARAIALAGPLLAFTNHLMSNQFTSTAFGVEALLNRAGGSEVSWFFGMIRDVTIGGRLAMLALVAGAILVVAAESLILRSVGKRDMLFSPLPVSRVFGMLRRAQTKAGAAQLVAADQYVRLRRSIYLGGWQTQRAGIYPKVRAGDFVQLTSLAARLGVLPAQPEPAIAIPQAAQALPADAPADPGA